MTIHSVPRTDEVAAQPREGYVFDVVARVRELAERRQKLADELASVNARLDAIVQAATGERQPRDAPIDEPLRGRPPSPESVERRKTVVPPRGNVGGAPRMHDWIANREGTFKAVDLANGANVTDQYARTTICSYIGQKKVTKIEPGLYRRSETWA